MDVKPVEEEKADSAESRREFKGLLACKAVSEENGCTSRPRE